MRQNQTFNTQTVTDNADLVAKDFMNRKTDQNVENITSAWEAIATSILFFQKHESAK